MSTLLRRERFGYRSRTVTSEPALPAILVHGGAGHPSPLDPFPGAEASRLRGVEEAVRTGVAVLSGGGSALDAVEAAVRLLEDDPSFNAGTGACLTADGEVELDASNHGRVDAPLPGAWRW